MSDIYDVVGVGFGPSSLSLAAAVAESRGDSPERRLTAAFFERKSTFGWHRDMLLPSAKMQVSFLKDLATFRNPASSFSFVSYLHAMGRLAEFVNNQDFFPTRREFHEYLEWSAAKVADWVTYGAVVTGIELGAGGLLEVAVESANKPVQTVLAHNVAISTGLVPKMPPEIDRDDRVWHSSELLGRFAGVDRDRLARVAVAGAGQSAAEITRFFCDALPDASIFAILPSYGYSIADNTPFANEVFDPGAVEDHYRGSDESREAFWRYHSNTNYSVVDAAVIDDLYQRRYEDRLSKADRLNFLRLSRVTGVRRGAGQMRLRVESLLPDTPRELDVDLLVCATGYRPMQPSSLLSSMDSSVLRDGTGRYRVERDYRLITDPDLPGGIYLLGGTEHTHGLASSLLSNIAVRSGEIVESVLSRRSRRETGGSAAAGHFRRADSFPGKENSEQHESLRR
ncbi:lysine N(6)-hydroxylase/L-ornithine N(5)-oxygenase family protein [Amycolatopsis sp. VS8301801F10]|uniref:lysine N(6)-hydroxylase/L-ornithine N(5)-oxygenase family protein n=1 Tax=Amycolatopsis sp. VS8301801F10 TaxID=2652442 RepID=UPI0038FC180D